MKFLEKKRLFLALIVLVSLGGCETPHETSAPTHYHSRYYYSTFTPSPYYDPFYSPIIYDPFPYYPYSYYWGPYYGWGHRHHHWR